MNHLDALELRLSHEREYLRQATTEEERAMRAVWVAQIEKEIAAERQLLGMDTGVPDLSDDDLLSALEDSKTMKPQVRSFVDRLLEAEAAPRQLPDVPEGDAPESVQDAIVSDFKDAYVTAALALSTDDNDAPLDDTYSSSDLPAETLEKMYNDCNEFVRKYGNIIAQEPRKAGQDFWLTRNGHGAGFWDGDWEKDGELLTQASKVFGEVDLYVGDDGQIYQTP